MRQKIAFSFKNGIFLVSYIVSLKFPGIPGKFPEYFGNSRSREMKILREIVSPNQNRTKTPHKSYFLLTNEEIHPKFLN